MKTATKKPTAIKATKQGTAVSKNAVKKSAVSQKKAVKKDLSKTYNEFKEFEGQQYTGMKIGRSHKWNYDAGVIEFLQEIITQLEKEPTPIEFTYNEKHYLGEAIPIGQTCHDGLCEEYDIILNDASMGIIRRMKKGWKIDGIEDKKFVGAIGDAIVESSPK